MCFLNNCIYLQKIHYKIAEKFAEFVMLNLYVNQLLSLRKTNTYYNERIFL